MYGKLLARMTFPAHLLSDSGENASDDNKGSLSVESVTPIAGRPKLPMPALYFNMTALTENQPLHTTSSSF